MRYIPKHFTAKEIFHPDLLKKYGEENCWRRMNPGLLKDADIIRERWGSAVYVNVGKYDSRGMRPPNDPDGANFSSHKHGNALDLVPGNGQYQEFWNFVRDLINDATLKHINVMEDFSMTPTWAHVAQMNIEEKLLIIFP